MGRWDQGEEQWNQKAAVTQGPGDISAATSGTTVIRKVNIQHHPRVTVHPSSSPQAHHQRTAVNEQQPPRQTPASPLEINSSFKTLIKTAVRWVLCNKKARGVVGSPDEIRGCA